MNLSTRGLIALEVNNSIHTHWIQKGKASGVFSLNGLRSMDCLARRLVANQLTQTAGHVLYVLSVQVVHETKSLHWSGL